MNIKEMFNKKNENDLDKILLEEESLPSLNSHPFILSSKINNIVKWIGKQQSNADLRNNETLLRDTIEKVAVWYEIKYPAKVEQIAPHKEYLDNYAYLGIYHNDKIMSNKEFFNCLSLAEKQFLCENDTTRDLFLKAVLYRIIERGYAYIGTMRGLKFAHEFNLNIDIPMFYLSYNNVNNYNHIYSNNCLYVKACVEDVINEYLSYGGNKDFVCLKDYWYSLERNQPFETTTIKDILENEDFAFSKKKLHKQIKINK